MPPEEWMMQEKQYKCLLRNTYDEALHFAEMLHSDNTDRKEADGNITEEALTLITENDEWLERKSTVVYQISLA